MIGGAITGDLDTKRGNQRIMHESSCLLYQVN